MESQAEEFFKIVSAAHNLLTLHVNQEKDKYFVHIVIKREDGAESPSSDFYSQKDLKEIRKLKTFQIYGDFSSLKEDEAAYRAYLETMKIYQKLFCYQTRIQPILLNNFTS
jgi:hypothetical protein